MRVASFFAVFLIALSSLVQADPVSDFKALVARCQSSLDQTPVTEIRQRANSPGWTKSVRSPHTVSFDVKRTDSLIAPLAGFLVIETKAGTAYADDEVQAQSAPAAVGSGMGMELKTTVRFTYREDANLWQFADAFRVVRILQDSKALNGSGDKIRIDKSQAANARWLPSECLN